MFYDVNIACYHHHMMTRHFLATSVATSVRGKNDNVFNLKNLNKFKINLEKL